MSIHRCGLCGNDPGVFFVWSSSRTFPLDKLMMKLKIKTYQDKQKLKTDSKKICFGCLEELKNL